MPTSIEFEIPADTSHFTALQLQPRTLLSLSWNGYARWLREHLVSLRSLIREHKFGTVIMGAKIDYGEPFTFFDGDTLEIRLEVGLWARQILQLNVDFFGARRNVARVHIMLYPLEIQDTETLVAVPTQIPIALVNRLEPNLASVTRSIPNLEVPERVDQIEQSGQLLVERRGPFTVHHHLCEVAEQWSFIEVPGIVEAVREPLAFEQHRAIPLLRRCLSQPLQSLTAELSRPYFVFEEGQVETRSYLWHDKLVFVHRLFSDRYHGEAHGTIIEEF